jgi:hypothetical protein
MDAKTKGKNPINSILIFFVIINIIGEIGNVIAWWAVPSMQISLVGGTINDVTSPGSILFSISGANGALYIGSAILLAVAAVYIASLFGLSKKLKWAPLLVIAVSVVNRLLALVVFAISAAYAFWAVWTFLLVVVAFLDYRKLSTAAPAAPEQNSQV